MAGVMQTARDASRRQAAVRKRKKEEENALVKQKFQNMSTMKHSTRSLGILKAMRHTEVSTDATVTADGVTFKIHRNAVGWLSPKFHDVFLKNRKAEEQVHKNFDAVSSKAFSVVLDYAYGVDVEPDLSESLDLALDVRVFAAVYEISQLKSTADQIAI